MPAFAAPVLLWFVLGTGPAPVQISWRVESERGCPTVGQLEAAYARLAAVRPLERATGLSVLVEIQAAVSTGLVVYLSITGLPFSEQRELDVGKSPCAEVAQTLAILVHTWVGLIPELVDTTVATEPTPATSVEPFVAPNAPPAALARVRGEPGSSSAPLGVTLSVGIDLLVAPGVSAAPAASFAVELDITPQVGVGLLVSWMGDLSLDDPPYGSIVVRRQLFGTTASWALPGTKDWGVRGLSADILSAFVLWHGTAESFEYPVTRTQQLFEPGLMAAVRLRQALGGPMFLQGQFSAVALVRSLSLQATRPAGGPATVADLPWLTLAVGLSLGVRFF